VSTINFNYERISLLVTAVSGTGYADLPDGMAEEIQQIVCQPAISNNMYTIRLMNKDDNDMVMWTRDVEETHRENMSLPVYGNYKVNISGAVSDDAFKIRFLYR